MLYQDQSTHSSTNHTPGSAPAWLTILARSGYAARGVIYLIIGSLALLQAFGSGGEQPDSNGAVEQLLSAPFGKFLLWAMVLGLIGYAVWRFIQAVMDTDNHGIDAKGISIRGGLLVSALTHIALAFYTGTVALNQSGSSSGSSSGDSSSESWTSEILTWPGGQVIVVLIGLAIIGAAIAHAVKAYKEKYRGHLDVDASKMEKMNPVCKYGLYARGVAFAIIGGFFIWAAITQDPEKAGGLRKAFVALSQQAFGTMLVTIMAIGLLAFGVYSIIEAVYRRIDLREKAPTAHPSI